MVLQLSGRREPTHRQSIGNYAKYIAAREGVELLDNSQKYAPATTKQQELICRLLRDFPDCPDMFEYQDYRQSHTVATASDFINRAIEDHSSDIIGRKGYAKYIGTRPGWNESDLMASSLMAVYKFSSAR